MRQLFGEFLLHTDLIIANISNFLNRHGSARAWGEHGAARAWGGKGGTAVPPLYSSNDSNEFSCEP